MRTALMVGLLSVLTALAGAAPVAGPGPLPAAGPRIVTLRVHDSGSWTVVISVAIGNAATVSRPGMPVLRIRPAVSGDGLLSVTGSLVSTADDAMPLVSEVAITGPIAFGTTARLDLGSYVLDLAWIDDKTVGDTPTTSEDPVSECCVVCEGVRFCACRVQAPCGSCCDQACGGCGQTGSQTACALGARPQRSSAGASPGNLPRLQRLGAARSRQNTR
jgi:hypothetical protein